MEKKRRARINKCLDQLKNLLESYYSTNVSICESSNITFNEWGFVYPFIWIHISLSQIRKRKLEKADILELTVNHIRNLQKIQSCRSNSTLKWFHWSALLSLCPTCLSDFAGNVAASELSDYQSGFRRCVANVDEYVLMADSLNGSERWMISQLSGKLWRSRRGEDAISTTDSGPSRAKRRDDDSRFQPKVNEEANVSARPARDRHPLPWLPTEDARLQPGSKPVRPDAAANDKSPTDKKTDSAADRNESANMTLMWRPW